jgi:hypothetical protein
MFIIDEIYLPTSLNDVNDTATPLKAVSSDRMTEKLPTKIKNRARLPKSATTRSHAPIQSLSRKRSVFDKVKDVTSLNH